MDKEKAIKDIRDAVRRGQKVLTDASIMEAIIQEIGSAELVRAAIAETEAEDRQQEYVSTGGNSPSRQVRPVYEQNQEPQLSPSVKSIVTGVKKKNPAS
jgi:hypothetical protein